MLRKFFFAIALLASALLVAQESMDLSVVNRIRSEAFDNSKVMNYIFDLTEVNGPRLTGSPGYKSAADWAVRTMKEIGLSNAHEEKWGPFGRGWTFTHYSGQMLEPSYSPLIGAPYAWTNGTNGPVTGEAVIAIIQAPADMERYRGKLKGKIVMTQAARELAPPANPFFNRYSESQMADLTQFRIPSAPRPPAQGQMTPEQQRQFQTDLANFWKKESPLALVRNSTGGEGGAVFGGGANREIKDNITTVVIATEQYNRIMRLLQHDPPVPVKLQFEVKAEYFDSDLDSYNVVGEIPGNAKKDEVVMLGGHLDSWHYATGATDDAVGVAVGLEAMRILKALNLKMDRTVRLALWSAEEQGLLGSAAYVKEHFADRATMKTTAEHDKFQVYFNIDNGAGKIRGVYAQSNDMARPIFEKWMEPFRDLGMTVVSPRNTSGTDHVSFDRVGLPGFQFVQDPLDYMSRTHHSNMDLYDRLQREDILQMAAIQAAFVYQAATMPGKFPRKPLPKAQPASTNTAGSATRP